MAPSPSVVSAHASAPESLSGTVRRAAALLSGTDAVAHRFGTVELAEMTADVLTVMQLAEAAAVTLAREAHSRGLVTDSTAANLAQWVAHLGAANPVDELLPGGEGLTGRSGPLVPLEGSESSTTAYESPDSPGDEVSAARATAEGLARAAEDREGLPDGTVREDRPPVPGLEVSHAFRIARVAIQTSSPVNRLAADHLAEGQVSVASADLAIAHTEKVMPILPERSRDQILADYLTVTADAGTSTIRQLTKILVSAFATEESLEHADTKLERVESVRWSELGNGLHRLVADLTAPHAATLRAAIDALAAPSPGNTCCTDPHHRHRNGEPTGEADPRPREKRCADALVLLTRHGAATVGENGSILTTAPTQLVITTDLDVLKGLVAGYGLTSDGDVLTPTQIRHLACDAELIPMTLGSDGEPLDVGRTERLATRAIRRAVAQRDRHCTFPGCDRQPSWCQVHHIVPWWAGGETSLANSTLLCQRHHTVVHRDHLTAERVAGQITWDLTPGRMASACPGPSPNA